ncbi:MAG: hypothetical protein ACL93V_04845 [Candidatus Electrothrix sp. YB6]
MKRQLGYFFFFTALFMVAATASTVQAEWQQVGAAGFSSDEIWFPSLALAGDSTPYVAYEDNANGGRISMMRFDGTNWVQVGEAGFSAGKAESPSLA